MKVLLTGASGFVGSHVLEALRSQGVPVSILLRATSSSQFIAKEGDLMERRLGSLQDPASLTAALTGITHVIHCAGATKARTAADFFEVNQVGTRNLALAAARASTVRRFVLVSSLAAAGPGTREHPSREDAEPRPVSIYGRSKLAGERELAALCDGEYTIVRPPAVYGPRDAEFLKLFRTVKNRIRPLPSPQPLSLVYVQDLAAVIVALLNHPGAAGQTVNVASTQTITAAQMAREIAAAMRIRALPVPVPTPLLWPFCLLHQCRSLVTGIPGVLSLQKYAELKAEGWVCDVTRLTAELGLQCATTLGEGIARTLNWYRENKWL